MLGKSQIFGALIGATVTVVMQQPAVKAELSQAEIATLAQPVTVTINGQNPGSGVLVAKEGNTYYVLTAKHVVPREDEYEVVTPDGESYPFNYQAVQKFPGIDLALVRFTSSQDYPVATLGNSNTVEQGSTTYVAGLPHPGVAITQRIFQVTKGNISGVPTGGGLEEGYSLIYTNTTSSGMSGGPVFDGDGNLIGIHGRAEGQPIYNADTGDTLAVKSGFNLAIPINTYFDAAREMGIHLPHTSGNFFRVHNLDFDSELGAIAITPDSQTLVASYADGKIRLWDLNAGELKTTLQGETTAAAVSLKITPDGKTLISADANDVRIWDLQTGQLKTTLSDYVAPLAMSGDGATIAVRHRNGTQVHLLNSRNGQLQKTLDIPEVEGIAFSRDGQTLVTNSAKVQIWDLQQGNNPRTLISTGGSADDVARCVAISPDGTLATSNLAAGYLWNLETGELLDLFSPRGNKIACLYLSFGVYGKNLLLSTGNPAEVYLWNLDTQRRLSFPDSGVFATLSPDGQTVVTAHAAWGELFLKRLIVWQANP